MGEAITQTPLEFIHNMPKRIAKFFEHNGALFDAELKVKPR